MLQDDKTAQLHVASREKTRFYVATPNGDLESLVVSMPWFEADKDTHLD